MGLAQLAVGLYIFRFNGCLHEVELLYIVDIDPGDLLQLQPVSFTIFVDILEFVGEYSVLPSILCDPLNMLFDFFNDFVTQCTDSSHSSSTKQREL